MAPTRKQGKYIKISVILTNILYLVISIGLISAGIHLLATNGAFSLFIGSNFFFGAALLLICGIAVFVVSIVGVAGAYIQRKRILIIYLVVVAIIIFFEVISAILGFAYSNQVTETASSEITEAMENYLPPDTPGYDKSINEAVDNIQQNFRCCGWNATIIWESLPYFDSVLTYPESCECNTTTCMDVDTGQRIFSSSCSQPVTDAFKMRAAAIGGVGLFFAILQVIPFLLVVSLIYVIHKNQHRLIITLPPITYVDPEEERHEEIVPVFLDTRRSILEWNHDNLKQVGGLSVLTIKLMSNRGSPYTCKPSDYFHCEVQHIKETALGTQTTTVIPHVIEPGSLTGQNTIKISFTAKISGQYSIRLTFNRQLIGANNIYRKYLPGPVDSNKTVFVDFSAVFLVTKGVYKLIRIIPKDSYGNEVDIDENSITVEIKKDGENGTEVTHELVVSKEREWCELLIKLDQEGHYVACIKYQGQRIGPPNFTILSLSEQNMQIVENNVERKSKKDINYEARDVINNSKKVRCYLYSRQFQVRESTLLFFRKRTRSYKVSLSTKIIFHPEPQHFTVDDGFQEPLKLESRHREIIGATYHRFLCQNIGGSEKFQDKRDFFYSNLRDHCGTQHRTRKDVTVSRIYLLESAMEATRRFRSEDWYKKFNIIFRHEPGLDYGGVGREFFELICVNLFDASNRLFMQFNDENHQALVHPNYSSKRPSNLTLEHFNFAGKIVGKCLYESAMGNTLLVKARFTRSFLAQLIGLRINYMYFESDDPDLYTTKIQYILEQDMSEEDLGLVFAEEEFDSHNGHKVVPLIANGERKEVTERNKRQYLNELAQYRFTRRVSEEIQEFLNGLNEIIPDNLGLLSTFNEHELELLMCGIDQVSYEDLKEHANVSGSSLVFQRVLAWFWTTVSAFTQEEMAKLLQFVTGCSQLPPGGFAELNPRFTITSAPTTGRLPTAHTCFNRLCLPEYSSCEQFQTSLMIALNEGAEGFGME